MPPRKKQTQKSNKTSASPTGPKGQKSPSFFPGEEESKGGEKSPPSAISETSEKSPTIEEEEVNKLTHSIEEAEKESRQKSDFISGNVVITRYGESTQEKEEEDELPIDLFSRRPKDLMMDVELSNKVVHDQIIGQLTANKKYQDGLKDLEDLVSIVRFKKVKVEEKGKYESRDIEVVYHEPECEYAKAKFAPEQDRTILSLVAEDEYNLYRDIHSNEDIARFLDAIAKQREHFLKRDCCSISNVNSLVDRITLEAIIRYSAQEMSYTRRLDIIDRMKRFDSLSMIQKEALQPQFDDYQRKLMIEREMFAEAPMSREQLTINQNKNHEDLEKLKQQVSLLQQTLEVERQSNKTLQLSFQAMTQQFVQQNPNQSMMENSVMGSSSGTAFLVQSDPVPNWESFTPSKNNYEYRKMISYVRNCESKSQDLRIDHWPASLRQSINHHWMLSTMFKDGHSDEFDPESWQQLPVLKLKEWMESLDSTSALDFSKDSCESFRAHIVSSRPTIHWDHPSENNNPHDHPFINGSVEYLKQYQIAYDAAKAKGNPFSIADQKELCATWAKSLQHKGIADSLQKERTISTIKSRVASTDTFPDAVKVTVRYVGETLLRIYEARAFLVKDNPGKSQSGQSKSSSTQSSQKRLRQDTQISQQAPKKSKSVNKSNTKDKSYKGKPNRVCSGCGWIKKRQANGVLLCNRYDGQGCSKDPRRNNTSKPWAESEVGKQWAELKLKSLPMDPEATLDRVRNKRKESKSFCLSQYVNNLLQEQDLINFNVCELQQQKKLKFPRRSKPKVSDTIQGGDKEAIAGRLLLDTGAIGCSVVSSKFFDKLSNCRTMFTAKRVRHNLITALDEKTIINKKINFKIIIESELTHLPARDIVVSVDAIVADINVDLILSREIIKNNNLLYYFPSYFAQGDLLNLLNKLPVPVDTKLDKQKTPRKNKAKSYLCFTRATQPNETWLNACQVGRVQPLEHFNKKQREISQLAKLASNEKETTFSLNNLDHEQLYMNQQQEYDAGHISYLAALSSNFSKKPAFEREGNLTDIPDNKLESIPAELISDIQDEAEYIKVKIEGSNLVKQRISELVKDFKDIFKATVQGTPAKLVPFKLEVDNSKWCLPANQLNVRPMDRERAQALKELVTILAKHHIIEACDESYYSHAFLVPKPNGKWRLVLDFKNLNKATTNHYKWPIPNIPEMLNRVGESRPHFFAVFDLTSGYYQAPIEESSRGYTAFRTRDGVYRWKRLPMGLTGAGSYFQYSLTTQVLQGLIQHGVELYLDDCIVHAPSIDEFIEKLAMVFQRFRNSGVTLNPAKCNIGLTSVEYVGHTIDKDGLHFTRSKIDSVLQFPCPQTKKQLKSFLGLANYFRDHIRNHSVRVQDLQELVLNYDKRHAHHRINWTDKSLRAFEDIREAIDNCPKLWFLDDYSPIFLQTDASDYGIGAYLYQVITKDDGSEEEHPIGFISKALANQHTNWDTPMKEGYAIFYALKKWEYLLRDRTFTVLTDHKNLTRLRADHFETNKMVKRWFLAYQEYDIKEWGYKKGVDNMVPDQFSRLCPETPSEHIAVHLYHVLGESIPTDKWDLLTNYHNSLERGHGGVNRTLDRLVADGHLWENMFEHIRTFIKLCPCCQKMDQMKKVIHSYPFTTSSYGLWETVSVDFIEKLRPDEYGYSSIVVIVDNFSRFTDLHAVREINAENAADALLSFVGRYATPARFCTDSGTSFKNLLIKGLTERLGVKHHLTTAYSKEQNAIVERQNKEILRHLRNIIFDHRVANKWSKYLPLVQRIINTSVNSSTGVAPADVVFPNGTTLDNLVLAEANPMYMSTYISELQRAQERFIALCELNLRDKDSKHMENYPKERTVFENGAYVLAEHRPNSLRRGPKSKLLPFLRGPLLVKSHNEEGTYVLQDLVTQKLYDYHVSRLRHFEFDPNTLNPLTVAVTDLPDEFIVEECLDIRGNIRGPKSQLEFKIRWAGYGPEDDTWEPWSCVRDNERVLSYLYNHDQPRVRRLVPKSYVPPHQRIGDDAPSEEELDIAEEEEIEQESLTKLKDLGQQKDNSPLNNMEPYRTYDRGMALAAYLQIH